MEIRADNVPDGISEADHAAGFESSLANLATYRQGFSPSIPIVRTRHGRLEITTGPFSEVNEVLAGYDIIEWASLDRATTFAAGLTESEFNLVEVRQLSNAPTPFRGAMNHPANGK